MEATGITIETSVPERISGLEELSLNLWWSWNKSAADLFRIIDPAAWLLASRNPVRFLKIVSPVYLDRVADDPAYLDRYDSVMERFQQETNPDDLSTWIASDQPHLRSERLAYLSAEVGLHPTLPIYSGGLGVLAGDHIKAASDLGLPLVAMSLLYRHGYLRQKLDEHGWQLDVPGHLEPEFEPAVPVYGPEGEQLTFEVTLDTPDRPLHLALWQVKVGRLTLYLLDSDVEGNPEWTRSFSARLYGGDVEHRLRQEIILGIGGVRGFRATGADIQYWHGNEGHAAFHLLERCRILVQEQGLTFDQAADSVRATSVFTTHTPVPAGHDVFSHELMDRYFSHYWPQLGLSREDFLALGEHESTGEGFNMTALSFRLSNLRNGVSETHGQVSREMWHDVWPDRSVEDVPLTSITNGTHVATWTGRHMGELYSDCLGAECLFEPDNAERWEQVGDIPDAKYWNRRRRSKRSLLRHLRERSRRRWIEDGRVHADVLASGPFFEEGALTIGFARRFATYKRATLLFKDPDRLAAILTNPEYPVQIVFAGKAHPADQAGKALIQEIVDRAQDPLFGGRIAFAENYDMELASYLVSGVDVWLNNPVAPMEASGTSGMKAAINGVPNLSILDGWWVEGWDGANTNGWGIPSSGHTDSELRDVEDANAIYDVLENSVVPLFYEREATGIPHDWIALAKRATISAVGRFSAQRMVKDYTTMLYSPAAEGSEK